MRSTGVDFLKHRDMSENRQTVVVGVIFNHTKDRVLLSRRPADAHMGGMWEFPGGKSIPGESSFQTLSRELVEETGIVVERAHSLTAYDHDYPDLCIRLQAWVIDSWSGIVSANEGQLLEWVALEYLQDMKFPEANLRLLKLLKLPELYLITPDRIFCDDGYLALFRDLIGNGLKLIQFRSKNSDYDDHKIFVKNLIKICSESSCILIYNGTPQQAIRLGAHGVHLDSVRLMQCKERPLNQDLWVAASCHDYLEIEHAVRIGVDFCVVSPVHQSPSHPRQPGMGWQEFGNMVLDANIPIYALGGVKPEELILAQQGGAHGIAMISGVWNAPDPVKVIRQFS